MPTILVIFYFILFFLGVYNIKFLCYILPIFVFCYPEGLTELNWGGVNLYMLFIPIAYLKFYLSEKKIIYKTNLQVLWYKCIIMYVVFIAYYSLILSLIFAPQLTESSIFDIIYWTLILLTMLLYCKMCSIKYLKTHILIGLCLTVLLESIISIGLLQYFNTFQYFYDGREDLMTDLWRATGTFKGPWDLGGFLAISISFLISEAIFRIKKETNNILLLLMIITIIISFYALILTQSRASWLLLFIYIIIFSIFSKGKALIILIPVILLTFILLDDSKIININAILNHRIDYSINNSQTGGIDNSTLERFSIWNRILNDYDPLYLIFGYGIKTVLITFGSSPHNTYISLLVNGGLVSIIYFLVWINKIQYISCKIGRDAKIIVLSIMIGVSFYSMTADFLYNAKVVAIMLIYFTYIFYNYESKNVKN